MVFLLIGFSFSLFLIALVIGKRNKTLNDKVLISMFAVYALTTGGTYIELYNVENNYPFPHLMNINWLFLLLHGPLLWLYVKSLTVADFRLKPIHGLHLAPFVAIFILHYSTFLHLTAEEKLFQVKDGTFTTNWYFTLGVVAVGVSSIGYNILALRLLKKHLISIKNTFSNIEDKDLQWLKTLVIASLVIFTINVSLYNLNNYLRFADYYTLAKVAYSFSTVYVLYIGYHGIRQGTVFVSDANAVLAQHSLSSQESDFNSNVNSYLETIYKLSRLMEDEQPYLDPELNLAKLSSLMRSKPEAISEVLNSHLGQNFFDYINKHRIEEFKIKCLSKEYKHLSIMGIAYECGFNSKAAFYRAFNKFEGISPTGYMARVS